MTAPTPEPTPQDTEEARQIAWAFGLPGNNEGTRLAAQLLARARHAGEVAERERCARLLDHKSRHAAISETFVLRDAAAAIRSLAPDSEGKK